MSGLEFRFIGTGNAFAPGGLCWNGFVANRRYLFEAPPQALQSLNALHIDANELDAVVLSHHHGDHFLGLPFLVLQWKYSKRSRPIRIIGPAGTRELACDIGLKVYPGLFDGGLEIEWEELGPGESTSVAGLQLEAVPVAARPPAPAPHAPGAPAPSPGGSGTLPPCALRRRRAGAPRGGGPGDP